MKKKTLLQLLILLIIIFIIVYFYSVSNENKKKINQIKSNDKVEILNTKDSNLIYNLKYVVEGADEINYIISSERGELKVDQPDLILMKKVLAVIKGKNNKPLKITADKAIYNTINHNTEFYENVLMTYEKQQINSNNFDLVFEKNLATITNNVLYKNPNTKLLADKVEIDIITKNLKIFMYDNNDKIKIITED
ncbi:LPS export ABC transporter periplasmic protein LptC [Candidatus Pelagibacter sp.]|nr:LPS export ABC transporter periplasmic protein LptC [Candidatus Pelagibacter sp.]